MGDAYDVDTRTLPPGFGTMNLSWIFPPEAWPLQALSVRDFVCVSMLMCLGFVCIASCYDFVLGRVWN